MTCLWPWISIWLAAVGNSVLEWIDLSPIQTVIFFKLPGIFMLFTTLYMLQAVTQQGQNILLKGYLTFSGNHVYNNKLHWSSSIAADAKQRSFSTVCESSRWMQCQLPGENWKSSEVPMQIFYCLLHFDAERDNLIGQTFWKLIWKVAIFCSLSFSEQILQSFTSGRPKAVCQGWAPPSVQ